ncbi:hypothetical protein [Pleurocapsa sp. FMAR1]|uniref:hypothetical protein n=1 Tax=Pleurocapsa sp. FMAR1 TaxID=3040204 RepID=UPI0029C8D990|nr:hypothetical protein [Pleurocapsa sp. FMAR1]
MATRKKSRLIKGSLAATLQASQAVDGLQAAKLQNGNDSNFCYFSNVEENWNELVEQEKLGKKLASRC